MWPLRYGYMPSLCKNLPDPSDPLRDVLAVRIGDPQPGSSAQTGLHLARYRRDPLISALVHIHAPNATILSRRIRRRALEGYELLKPFSGIRSHAVALSVPIFANSQNTPTLAETIENGLGAAPDYLLGRHVLYS